MAGTYKVTPEELQTGESNLRKTAGQIANELTNAKNEVTRLMNSWEGGASNNFRDLMQRWDAIAKQQQENLDQIARTLGQAGRAYGEQEDTAKRAFQG